jgi:hypothetical protein
MATKSKSPIIKDGPQKGWTHLDGDQYAVTGIDREGKKFSLLYPDWQTAQSINVWRGTKWLIRDGKRYVIQRIYN